MSALDDMDETRAKLRLPGREARVPFPCGWKRQAVAFSIRQRDAVAGEGGAGGLVVAGDGEAMVCRFSQANSTPTVPGASTLPRKKCSWLSLRVGVQGIRK